MFHMMCRFVELFFLQFLVASTIDLLSVVGVNLTIFYPLTSVPSTKRPTLSKAGVKRRIFKHNIMRGKILLDKDKNTYWSHKIRSRS